MILASGMRQGIPENRRMKQMILADKIISLRKKAGWSQEELAGQLEVSAGDTSLRRVTMEEAYEYLAVSRKIAPKEGLATFLCVVSPITLILLGGLSELPDAFVPEGAAVFLIVSFVPGENNPAWKQSWVIWPVAGVLYGAVVAVMKQIGKRK